MFVFKRLIRDAIVLSLAIIGLWLLVTVDFDHVPVDAEGKSQRLYELTRISDNANVNRCIVERSWGNLSDTAKAVLNGGSDVPLPDKDLTVLLNSLGACS